MQFKKFHAGIKIGDNVEYQGEIYQILSKVGEGGMAIIWLAHHVRVNRYVVIKQFIQDKYVQEGTTKSLCEQFWEKESEITKIQAASPLPAMKFYGNLKLTPIDYFFLKENEYYLLFEWIDGKPLDTWFLKHYPSLSHFGSKEIAKVIRDVLIPITQHLAYVHSRNILHLDLTPRNIMIEEDDRTGKIIPKIIDWGIATIIPPEKRYNPAKSYFTTSTNESYRISTRGAPPELRGGYQAIAASDIYELGHIFFFIFTGGNERATVQEPNDYILRPGDYNLELPPACDELCVQMTQYEPADRIQKMSIVVEKLEQLLTTLS